MGIRKITIDLMDIACESMNKNFSEIKVCELGNQHVKDLPKRITGKQYLTGLGADHTSIDLNGKDGAIPLDLSKPIKQWNNYFDMLTNYGTTEHVRNQYHVFRNIHSLVKVGGTMVHVVPMYDYWLRHGYVNYDLEFFNILSQANRYDIILIESRMQVCTKLREERFLICAVFYKQEDSLFINEDAFYNIKGLYPTKIVKK